MRTSFVAAMLLFGSCAVGQYQATVLYKVSGPVNTQISLTSFVGQQNFSLGTVVGTGTTPVGGDDAIFWKKTGTPTDLTSAAFPVTFALGGTGNVQVGYGFDNANLVVPSQALMWKGTAGSVINLAPAGYKDSQANATDGNFEVGFATKSGISHATLWAGSNAVTDLHPAGYDSSIAYGVGNGMQVGVATINMNQHAALWKGSAGTFTDLNNTNVFLQSVAYNAGGNQQVGYGYNFIDQSHGIPPVYATLWTGTAASMVDLNPAGAYSSVAYATNGKQQVGSVSVNDGDAAVWSGSADSFVDLQPFLPAMFAGSQAEAIDDSGNIFGYAQLPDSEVFYAVEWTPVPEPAAIGIIAIASVGLCRSRAPLGGRAESRHRLG